MTYFLSAFFFPIASLVVLFGIGLLVAAAGGNRVRPELVPPIGLGALIVFGQFTTWAGISTPANVILMLVLSAVGYGLLARKRGAFWPEGGEPRNWGWWLVPGTLAGGLVLATIIFNGNASMAGFLVDSTSTVQMLGGDFALHGSQNFASAGSATADNALIYNYFGATSYPYGSQIAYALLGSLSGTGLLYVYTPFMALMVALSGFGIYRIARLLDLSRAWSGVAVIAATSSAIVYSHALQGAIKEITFIPLLVILGLLLLDPLLRSTPRSLAVTGAVVATGAIGAIGVAAAAWIVPLGLCALLAQTTRFGGDWGIGKTLKALGLAFAALFVAMIPKLGGLYTAARLATALSKDNAKLASDPGNLHEPVHKLQAFGVWLGGNHRFVPKYGAPTWILIGVVVLALLAGLYFLFKKKKWAAITWVAVSTFVWYALTWRGTLWLDSKLVLIGSHMVMVIAIYGAAQLKIDPSRKLSWPRSDKWKQRARNAPAYGVAAIIVLAVLGSDGLQYISTGMLPANRYKELATINDQFAGKGPAFMPDFDENALFQVRDIGAGGPGNAFVDSKYTVFVTGAPIGYGHSSDLDKIKDRVYTDFPLIIQRRGPGASRPGSDYDLVRGGQYYDVYRRNNVKVVQHLPVGVHDAVAAPNCTAVKKLADQAKKHDSLKLVAAIPTSPLQFIDNNHVTFTGGLALRGPYGGAERSGEIHIDADVAPGQELWWFGTVNRPITVSVDGKEVGTLRDGLGGDGNIVGPIPLPAGKHQIVMVRGIGSLAPGGHAIARIFGTYLASGKPSVPTEVDPADAESKICGQQVDWVELVRK